MKQLFLGLLLTTIMSCLSAQQEAPTMDFEEYDPPSSLVVPEHKPTHAKFRFIDIHSHHWRMESQDLDKLIREMDTMNMAIINNLSGRGGKALKAMVDHVNQSGYANRITFFTNIEWRGIDASDWLENTLKQIEYDVSIGAKGLKIYKSQGMTDKDSKGQRIAVNDSRLDAIWQKCGELGIPVLIHTADPKQFWEPHDANNERWLELKLRPNRKRSDTNPAP